MATRTIAPERESGPGLAEPLTDTKTVLFAFGAALAFVLLTRWPVMRLRPLDYDEVNFLDLIQLYWLPMHHTLFLASGRALGKVVGDPYFGIVILDMLVSALALTSVWWWLRALVRPAVAVAATMALGVGPVFWAYGAMAGNYTAIVLVGSFLLGVAVRTWRDPRPWHPYAAAVVLALGTGYRQDIGTFWLPVFFVILWRHRWLAALQAVLLFTALNLAWLVPMLCDVGGWDAYRDATADFARRSGYMNSVWHLGVVDAPLRYGLKAGMALAWTLGPGLLFAPRGLFRLGASPKDRLVAALLILSLLPALASHLLVHFGVPGYAFHYIPALIALVAIGIGRATEDLGSPPARDDHAPFRLAILSATLAAVFLFYPTDFHRPGLRGDFDLAFARHTRLGLRSSAPSRTPQTWRTANSRLVHDMLPEYRQAPSDLRGN